MSTFSIQGIGYDSAGSATYSSYGAIPALDAVRGINANAISIAGNSASVASATSSTVVNDPQAFAAVSTALYEASARGLEILLNPHLAVPGGVDLAPGDIAGFFASYKTMLLQYAGLAQQYGVESLAIGNEIDAVTGTAYKAYWDDIIASVRQVYSGKLTYAAGWDHPDQVSFWSELDYIGINNYVPLSAATDPSYAAIVAGWTQPSTDSYTNASFHGKSALSFYQGLAQSAQKPVRFTELGYVSGDRAAILPASYANPGAPDTALQATLYRAFFDVWGGQASWVQGDYVWGWSPYADPATQDPTWQTGFDPRGKAAEQIIAAAYGPTAALPAPPAGPVTTISVHVSGTSWNGAPELVLVVDGMQVGSAYVTADIGQGAWQDVVFTGQFGANGPNRVAIYFVNDAYGGEGMDRNLYVGGLTVNGVAYAGDSGVDDANMGYLYPGVAELVVAGSVTYGISGAPPLAGADTPPSIDAAGSTLSGTLREQGLVTASTATDGISGTLSFTDMDLGDTHIVGTQLASAAWSGGGTFPGIVQSALATGFRAAITADGAAGQPGTVAWQFAIGDASLEFLAAGETLTAIYRVIIDDGKGGSAAQAVTLTIAGANDQPSLAADGGGARTIAELPKTSGSTTLSALAGTLSFTDPDLDDRHTASATLISANWSSGKALPMGLAPTLAAAFAVSVASDTTVGTGTSLAWAPPVAGTLAWRFQLADKSLDFLAAGETLTLAYAVSIADASGVTATQPITIVATGADDAPTITASGTSATGTVTEAAAMTGSTTLDRVGGVIGFADPDLDDRPAASIDGTHQLLTYQGAVGTAYTLTAAQIAAFKAAFTIAAEAGNTNLGKIDWTASLPDNALDFLGAGESVTLTSPIIVSDGSGASVAQAVTVTWKGANDAPIALADFAGVTAGSSKAASVAQGLRANDGDADIHDALAVTAVKFGATNVVIAAGKSGTISGTFGKLSLASDGSYGYTATVASKSLPASVGQDMFTYTVGDGHGGTATALLTVTSVHTGQTYLGGAAGATLRAGNVATVLDGGPGGMTLIGGSQADVLLGGPGDTMTGGAGADFFVFHANFGKETLADFNVLADVIQIDRTLFTNFAAVQNHAKQIGTSTVITYDAADTITLSNVVATTLRSSDFSFA